MRSLFARIFFSFLMITLLASIATAMISYFAQIGPYGELKRRVQNHQLQTLTHTLSVAGLAVEEILDNGGRQGVVDYLGSITRTGSSQILLVERDYATFSGRTLSPDAENLAAAALSSGNIQNNVSDKEIMVAQPLTGHGDHPLVIIGKATRIFWPPAVKPVQGERQWLGQRFPHLPMGLPLLVMLSIAAIGCFLLARSLTAPLRHLRRTVQQITGGDFSARVDLPGRRRDEIADLSRDFNTMAEHTQSLLESRRRLLRDISHELRSPLTRQNIALELARRHPGNAEPYLERIEQESLRLNELIEQLLLLTRLEGDLDTFSREPVSLQELLDSIIHDADFEAADRDRGIKIHTVDNVTVPGSRELLRRALENVIRNGLRYTAAGSIVEVCTSKNDGSVAIIVRDHGPGIPPQYLEQIFTPFFRVAESRNRDSGGTGIGLAIARQAVLLHGGKIKAENSSKGGLVITIQLPTS
jgi:two-component system sensor histidine kinase CpxA